MVATIVLLIFLIVMMPAFGIYYLCQGIKSLYEGQFVFKGVVDKNRSKLLYEALGVSDRDLQVFHFDGKCFHLKEGIRHFSEFTSIRCLKTKNVKVRNKALPHNTTWMHTRVSGGPDRRYKHNPAIRQST